MLLKPATPLTILLLAAFALLLLSVLSTPIIKGIPLATFEDVDFGVFGYCKGDKCSDLRIGYSTSEQTPSLNIGLRHALTCISCFCSGFIQF